MNEQILVVSTSVDHKTARRVVLAFKAANLSARTIEPPEADDIEAVIEQIQSVVVVLSPVGRRDGNVQAAITFARAYDKQLLVTLANGTRKQALPFDLLIASVFDLRDEMVPVPQELVDAVRRYDVRRDEVASSESILSQGGDAPNVLLWTPLGQLTVLYWTFFEPRQVESLRETMGAVSLLGTTRWMASALIWLPMFILALGMNLDTLPSGGMSRLFVGGVLVSVLALWFLTGLFSQRPNWRRGLFTSPAIAGLIIGMGSVPIIICANTLQSVSNTQLGQISIIVLLIATNIAVAGPVWKLGRSFALVVGGGVILLTLFTVFASPVGGQSGNASPGGMWLFIVALIAIGYGMISVFNNNSTSGLPSIVRRVAFALWLAGLGVLAWLSLLGGWRFF